MSAMLSAKRNFMQKGTKQGKVGPIEVPKHAQVTQVYDDSHSQTREKTKKQQKTKKQKTKNKNTTQPHTHKHPNPSPRRDDTHTHILLGVQVGIGRRKTSSAWSAWRLWLLLLLWWWWWWWLLLLSLLLFSLLPSFCRRRSDLLDELRCGCCSYDCLEA